jgi:hypothetical protein
MIALTFTLALLAVAGTCGVLQYVLVLAHAVRPSALSVSPQAAPVREPQARALLAGQPHRAPVIRAQHRPQRATDGRHAGLPGRLPRALPALRSWCVVAVERCGTSARCTPQHPYLP